MLSGYSARLAYYTSWVPIPITNSIFFRNQSPILYRKHNLNILYNVHVIPLQKTGKVNSAKHEDEKDVELIVPKGDVAESEEDFWYAENGDIIVRMKDFDDGRNSCIKVIGTSQNKLSELFTENKVINSINSMNFCSYFSNS